MELKTKIQAEQGHQDLQITRDFDLPVDLVFRAYTEAPLLEQWMGTKVLKLENKAHGGYVFETTDPRGFIHKFHGTIHEFLPTTKIIRTFEMAQTGFPAQLEFLEFVPLSEQTSRLNIHIIYKSNAVRDELLKLPFAQGLNMAHQRLEQAVQKLL